MRTPYGTGRRLISFCLLLALMGGCTWGSKNGVPWWGTKKQKDEAAADLDKYGPVAFQRIDVVKKYGEYAAKGSETEKQQVASRLAIDIQTEQDPLVRIQIIRTLAGIPNETAAGVLGAGIKDPDSEVRIAVCEAWGKRTGHSKSPDEPSARMLAETLSSDTNIDVRLAAAKALGAAKNDPRAVGALAIALKDPDPAMQHRSVASLKQVSGQNFGDDVQKWQQWATTVAPPSAAADTPSIASQPQPAPR